MTKARDLANGGFGLILMKPSSVSVGATDNGKGTITFSAVSSVSLNNVFNSTYENYKIVSKITHSSATETDSYLRLRANGSDFSGATAYRFSILRLGTNGTSYNQNNTGQSYFQFGTISTYSPSTISAELMFPQLSSYTNFHMTNESLGSTANTFSAVGGGIYVSTEQADGFTIYLPSGTMTGTISVYGYNK